MGCYIYMFACVLVVAVLQITAQNSNNFYDGTEPDANNPLFNAISGKKVKTSTKLPTDLRLRKPQPWLFVRNLYNNNESPNVFKFEQFESLESTSKPPETTEMEVPDYIVTHEARDPDITDTVTDPGFTNMETDPDLADDVTGGKPERTRPTTDLNMEDGYVDSTGTADIYDDQNTTTTTAATTTTAPHFDESCMHLLEKETRMTRAQREAICKQIRQWEKDAKKKTWKPSARQAEWWNSLGENGTVGWDAISKKVRKEYRTLTDQERESFNNAVIKLKYSMIDNTSKYDIFVFFHKSSVSPGAHWGAAFLPFHREFLFRFQRAIHEVDETVSVPYWDSNIDHHLGDELAQKTVMWTEDFIGNGHGNVITGPFRNWELMETVDNSRILFRALYKNPSSAELYSDETIAALTTAPSLRSVTYCVNPEVESKHGLVHDWVGGVLGQIEPAPGDPIFYMHHGFIDCMWEKMRQRQRLRVPPVDPTTDYPTDAKAMGVGCNLPGAPVVDTPEESPHYPTNTMHPFGPLKNIDGLRDDYYDRYLACAPRPVCATYKADCGSPYLFCDQTEYRCAPKLIYGASCSRFSASDPCYKGVCCQGYCRQSCDRVE